MFDQRGDSTGPKTKAIINSSQTIAASPSLIAKPLELETTSRRLDPLYPFACGVDWRHTGSEEAGSELVRALCSPDAHHLPRCEDSNFTQNLLPRQRCIVTLTGTLGLDMDNVDLEKRFDGAKLMRSPLSNKAALKTAIALALLLSSAAAFTQTTQPKGRDRSEFQIGPRPRCLPASKASRKLKSVSILLRTSST